MSVIDFETTGLDPTRDRIIDLAIISGDEAFHTLIHPRRCVDATFIHGITDADVAEAPTFDEVIPDIISRLHGMAIASHNVAFELAFLNAEFARAGYDVSLPREVGICTMDQSRIYLHDGSHRLGACLQRAGLPHEVRHRALSDAMSARSLLEYYNAAEARGERVAERAVNRHGDIVEPAEWIRATRVAKDIVWPPYTS